MSIGAIGAEERHECLWQKHCEDERGYLSWYLDKRNRDAGAGVMGLPCVRVGVIKSICFV